MAKFDDRSGISVLFFYFKYQNKLNYNLRNILSTSVEMNQESKDGYYTPRGTCTTCASHRSLEPLGASSNCCWEVKSGAQIRGDCRDCDRSLCADCYEYSMRNVRAPVKQR